MRICKVLSLSVVPVTIWRLKQVICAVGFFNGETGSWYYAQQNVFVHQ